MSEGTEGSGVRMGSCVQAHNCLQCVNAERLVGELAQAQEGLHTKCGRSSSLTMLRASSDKFTPRSTLQDARAKSRGEVIPKSGSVMQQSHQAVELTLWQ